MDYTASVTWLIGFIHCLATVWSQENFLSPIICYECEDLAVNTTCSEAEMPEFTLNVTECRRGGCIKWTYYVNHQLRMRRTCSEKLNLNIQLTNVCKTERYGNGILCMCPEDLCNQTGRLRHNFISYLLPFVTAFVVAARRGL